MHKLSELNLPVYIFSDTNIDLMKYGSNHNSNYLLELSMGFGFLQLISKVTRIQGESATLLDHIFTNDVVNVTSSGVIIDSYSDHFITFCSLSFEKPKPKNSDIFARSINEENTKKFKAALDNLNWSNVLENTCTNTAYNEFWETFHTLFDLYFPLRQFKLNKNIHPINPFMTSGLLVSRKRNHKLYKI